ncbi:MAG: hypothetical protein Q8941_18565, partial [Bacteroidota bacterium]|nr:hypothetical protein [Bacteroidota bacterium]
NAKEQRPQSLRLSLRRCINFARFAGNNKKVSRKERQGAKDAKYKTLFASLHSLRALREIIKRFHAAIIQ